MRAYPAVLLGVLVALGGLGAPVRAGCVGPEIVAVQDGRDLVVTGSGFHAGCADTMSCTGLPGCERCTVDDPQTPYADVRVVLRGGDGREEPLGEVDAEGSRGALTLRAPVPEDLRGRVVVAALSPSGEATAAVVLDDAG